MPPWLFCYQMLSLGLSFVLHTQVRPGLLLTMHVIGYWPPGHNRCR